MDVLWLSEEDVRSLLDMDIAIEAVEAAFRDQGSGKTQMPPKSYLNFPKGDLRTMPAYLESMGISGVKIVNVHPNNPGQGLPTVMALFVLNSIETGAPLAVMGATYLTSMRTGAAGGIAANLLARQESKVVGLVGAGVQARTQLLALSRFFRIEEVKIADVSEERRKSLEADCRDHIRANYTSAEIKDACDCDILVTTTPSRSPLVESSWIKPGTHINAIGADARGKQELETSLTKKAKVIVDDITQASHSGEINVPISEGAFRPEDIQAQIGEIIVGKVPGRESPEEITIFDSTGLAIQDVATGSAVYKKALDLGIGSWSKFL